MLSLKTFLREKIPTARVTGDEKDFYLECNQLVSDTDIERWLNEFFTQTELRNMENGEDHDLTFNLEDSKREKYSLIVTNSSSDGVISVSFFKAN